MNSAANRVKEIVSDVLKFDIGDIASESLLVEDFMADDLDIAEIAEAIEDEFNISISCYDADGIVTVGDLIECVESKIGNWRL